jgi:hypothetical protein
MHEPHVLDFVVFGSGNPGVVTLDYDIDVTVDR